MKTLRVIGVSFMQRSRRQKLVLLSTMFFIPLLLALAFLRFELHEAVTTAESERVGARCVLALEEAMRLVQKHRTLRYLQLSGSDAEQDGAVKTATEVNNHLIAINAIMRAVDERDTERAWRDILQDWENVQSPTVLTKARDSYRGHTALMDKINQLIALVADKSRLTHDSDTDSRFLVVALAHTIPNVISILPMVTSQEGAYINSGLLEPNQDAMLRSSINDAKRELARLPAEFESFLRENPELRPSLQPQLASIHASVSLLDRAQNDVMNSVDQTTGKHIFNSDEQAMNGMYELARASASELDSLLAQRVELYTARLYSIFFVAIVGLIIVVRLVFKFSRENVQDANTPLQVIQVGDRRNPGRASGLFVDRWNRETGKVRRRHKYHPSDDTGPCRQRNHLENMAEDRPR